MRHSAHDYAAQNIGRIDVNTVETTINSDAGGFMAVIDIPAWYNTIHRNVQELASTSGWEDIVDFGASIMSKYCENSR